MSARPQPEQAPGSSEPAPLPPARRPTAERRGDAEALLFRVVEEIDAATGAPVVRRVETAAYREYRKRRDAFTAARATYDAAYEEAQRSPDGRCTSLLLAQRLQAPVTAAHDRLRAIGGEKFEQAETLLKRAAACDRSDASPAAPAPDVTVAPDEQP